MFGKTMGFGPNMLAGILIYPGLPFKKPNQFL